MKEEHKNEIWGIALLAITVLLTASLFSYNEQDLRFFTSSPTRTPDNYIGIVGAYISGILFLGIGKAAFIFPLLVFIWGLKKFSTGGVHRFYARLVGAGILFLALSSLISITQGPAAQGAFSGGGIIGYGLSDMLTTYLNLPGSIIILVFLIVLSFILATELSFKPILSGIVFGVAHIFKHRPRMSVGPEIKISPPVSRKERRPEKLKEERKEEKEEKEEKKIVPIKFPRVVPVKKPRPELTPLAVKTNKE